MMARLLSRVWKALRGSVQWRVLWLLHHKFMIGVSGVVLDDSGRVLLLRHRYWTAASWGLPSGYVKRTERLEDALAREALEETGYRIADVELLRLVSGYRLRLEVTYRARFAGGELRLDSNEILEAGFFPTDELPDGLLESHRRLIEETAAAPPVSEVEVEVDGP